MIEYGQALLKNNQPADAEPALRECVSIREKVLEEDHWWITEARRLLGECLTAQGADPSLALGARIEKLREAEAILIELANETLDNDAATEDSKAEAIQRVVDLYDAWHAAEPGKGYDTKADEWRAKLPPRAGDSASDD